MKKISFIEDGDSKTCENGKDGSINAIIDTLHVVLSINVVDVSKNAFSCVLIGVVDMKTCTTISSGPGHPGIMRLENVPTKSFHQIS